MKPKLSLEDTMNQLKAENKELRDKVQIFEMKYENTGSIMNRSHQIDRIKILESRVEESEYKHSLVCEALENLLDSNPRRTNEWIKLSIVARQALNGIEDV